MKTYEGGGGGGKRASENIEKSITSKAAETMKIVMKNVSDVEKYTKTK